MTSTMKISATLPELLVDTSNVDVEEVVEIESADEEEPNQQDGEEEPEQDDLETNAEEDETKIQNHSTDDDHSEDVERGTDED